MFEHCNVKFKPYETWFLYDNKGFYERSLSFGKCKICKKQIAQLTETRKADNKVFKQIVTGDIGVKKLSGLNKNSVNYSSQDLKVKKCKVDFPRGWHYAVNREVKVGKENKIRQYDKNFRGGPMILVKEYVV